MTRRARGFVGLSFATPVGDLGDEWRCALNPVFASDGSVSGTVITKERSTSAADYAIVGALDPRVAGHVPGRREERIHATGPLGLYGPGPRRTRD